MANNLRAAGFVIGFGLLVGGIAGWSAPAARVVAGVMLMLLAAWPYLRTRKV